MAWSSVSEFDNGSKYPKDYPRIYLFGDSLTERGFYEQDCGFGWKLRQYYADRVEVVNEGMEMSVRLLHSTEINTEIKMLICQ